MVSARLPRNPFVERDTDLERVWRKQRLALAFRIFGRFGFDEGVAGHITARDPGDPELFWVNPFGMSFKQITVDDLILVDHHGNVVEGTWPVNRAAFAIHSSIHEARPDVIAAAHSHSKFGRAFSALGRELEPLTQDSCLFFEDHALFDDYTGTVNDPEEGKRLGLLTVGHSVEETVFWYVTMERTCEVELLARSAGAPVLIDPDVARATQVENGGHVQGWFQGQPLFDWIAQVEPDAFGSTEPVD